MAKYMQAIGPSYTLADRKAAVQRSVNAYPKKLDGANYQMASAPGEVQVADLGAEGRGQHVTAGRMFTVAGSGLYELVSGSYTLRGTLVTSSGRVGIDANRDQMAIVDGNNLYVFTLATNVLTQITVPGWRGSYNVVEIDGYFVFADPGTDQFYLSAIDDGTQLDALDFSSADSSPDDIVNIRASHRQLWLFGEISTEIWINSGGADFPFVRYQSYTLDVGCVGRDAAINAADTLFWIGQTENGRGIVYIAAGNQPQRVSTTAVEEALAASTDITQATMWSYQIEGHEFIGINAPGMETTFVYDASQQQWHERAEWDAGWERLRADFITAYNGEHYAIDSTGLVTRLDASTDTLNGRVLRRERTWPHMVQPSLEPVSYRGVELSCKTGYGGQIALEVSNDGGHTFGPALLRGLGVTGRWMERVRWNALGTAHNRVFRLWQSDAVPFALYSASVDI
jgi:hypothetical protein